GRQYKKTWNLSLTGPTHFIEYSPHHSQAKPYPIPNQQPAQSCIFQASLTKRRNGSQPNRSRGRHRRWQSKQRQSPAPKTRSQRLPRSRRTISRSVRRACRQRNLPKRDRWKLGCRRG
ncbi:hypothetical protein FA95DRAFT_1681353, partial [Auriscalpium vulgare]